MIDRQKMVEFVSFQLPDGEGRLILAQGASPGEDIIADVSVCGGDLDIRSNYPEWATARHIYEHLRWRSMPSWEQQAFLRSDVLASKTVALQKQLEAYTAVAIAAPFRLQRIGQVWVVHFTVACVTKVGMFHNHRGLQHLAMLLARQDRRILSIDLDGRSGDLKLMGIIASERKRKSERECGSELSPAKLRDAYTLLQETYATAQERGDIDGMNDAEEDIARFQKEIGTKEKDFQKYVYQKETPAGLERTIHRSVGANLRRAYDILRDKSEAGESTRECADFLEAHVQPEGFGFAYRPPSHFRPDWLL